MDCCFGLSCDVVIIRHRGCTNRLLIMREFIASKGMEKWLFILVLSDGAVERIRTVCTNM